MKIFKLLFYTCLFVFMFFLFFVFSIKPKAINNNSEDYVNMSTVELTEIILNNDDLLVFNTSNSYKQGFDNLYYTSEIYRMLISKEDFHIVLLNSYLNIRHQDVFVEYVSKRIYSLDLLLSNEEILNKFSEEELETLYQELEVKREDRSKLDIVYHYDTNVFYESVEEQGLFSTYSSNNDITDYTPHGKEIRVQLINVVQYSPQDLEEERERIREEYPNVVEVYQPIKGFDCTRYAFYSQSIDNPYTIVTPNILVDYADGYLYTVYNSTIDIIPQPGDIIGYIESDINVDMNDPNRFNMSHYAVVESNPNNVKLNDSNRNEIIVTSKWGNSGGVYRHGVDDYRSLRDIPFNYFLFKLNSDYNVNLNNNSVNITGNFNLSVRNDTNYGNSFEIIKLNVQSSGVYSFSFISSNLLDVRLYDYSLGKYIDEPTTLTYFNSQMQFYYSHLKIGTYHLYVEYTNLNNSGIIGYTINHESNFLEGRMIVDPGSDWLCGTQITLYDYLYAPELTYNSNVIVEGFTRIIYFDNSIVDDTSRLNYTFFSSDKNVATVTNYGTIVAKKTDIVKQVIIYAVNNDNPNIRFYKVFIIIPYEIDEVLIINMTECININQSKYIELDVLVPFSYLQCYEWKTLNDNICSVDYLGKIIGISSGTIEIIGTYKYNPDVILAVTVDVS